MFNSATHIIELNKKENFTAIFCLALLYIFTARLSQSVAIPPGNVTSVWIPSSIILSAVFLFGKRVWPGIFLGAFFGNSWAYFTQTNLSLVIFAGCLNGIGDVLYAFVAVNELKRKCRELNPIRSIKSMITFVIYFGLIGSAISGLFGVSGLYIIGLVDQDDYFSSLLTWCTGDGVGALLFTPLILSFFSKTEKIAKNKVSIFEVSVFFAILVLITFVCLSIPPFDLDIDVPLVFIVPFHLWCIFRLGERLTCTAIAVVAFVAILSSFYSKGVFHVVQLNQSLIELQLYIAGSAITIFWLYALFYEKNKIQYQLLQTNSKLEERVAERTKTLNITNQELKDEIVRRKKIEVELKKKKKESETANQAKSNFLASMSHEIRTPLSVIVGFAEYIRSTDILNKEAKEIIEKIYLNSKHLNSLIDDILDFSKIESNKMLINIKEFFIREEINSLYLQLEEKAKAKGLYLKIDIEDSVPVQCETDDLKLRQILINLIGNSIKFTKRGGVSLTIKWKPLKYPLGLLECYVEDTGCGIGESERIKVFDSFHRADGAHEMTGTGLGLSIAKKLANLLGGDLQLIWSKKGKGSRFKLSIMAQTLQSNRQVQKLMGHKNYSAHGKLFRNNILIADDNGDIRFLLKSILTDEGAFIHQAKNGLEAVNLLKNSHEKMDAVLLDLQMPVLSGKAALNQIRKFGFKGPVIALTADATLSQRQKSMKMGFSAFYTKPIKPENLVRVICDLL